MSDEPVTLFLIEKDGERQCVTDLSGYPDWEVLAEGDHAMPVEHASWDGEKWVRDMAVLRRLKRNEVNRLKQEHEDAGAPTPFGKANSDADSRGKVNGLVTFAMLAKSMGVPFEQGFTLFDDSSVLVDADMMIALGMAVGSYVADVHAHSRALKAAIEAAEDEAALDAIDIEQGWPS